MDCRRRLLVPLPVAAILIACPGAPPTSTDADSREEKGPTSQDEDPIKVRVALNWLPEPEFGGFYEGVLGGHYAGAGFQVELIPGGPGAPTLALLESGQADLAVSSAEDILVKRARGLDVVALWPAFQTGPAGLMVHGASGVESFDDIASDTGHKIAIELGSPLQAHLWERYGWQDKIAAVPYAGSIGPFLSDPKLIQQAYITSEPCVAESKDHEVRFLKAASSGWNPYGTVLTGKTPAPPWIGRFIRATETAWIAYLKAPARANAELKRLNPELREAALKCITRAQKPYIQGDDGMGAMTQTRWEALGTRLAELGLIPTATNTSSAWIPHNRKEKSR